MTGSPEDPSAERIVQEWLNHNETDPVDPAVVPGPNATERRRLASLGGLTRSLLKGSSTAHLERHLVELPGLKEWLDLGPSAPADVLAAAESLLTSPGEDALARMYSSAVSSANRRRLGTFFTPQAEVEQMLNAWDRLGVRPKSVVDVGAGVGIFTRAATRRWPDAQVHAVDVNPVTLGLLGLRTAMDGVLVELSSGRPGVRLRLEDYVGFAESELRKLPEPRLVLGNPPYTRIQLLPQEDREALVRAAGGLCGSRASLSALITAVTIRQLGPQDGLCLLLPAQWLESDYAAALRQWLWSTTTRPVHLNLFDHELFADAQVDAVSLLVGPATDHTHTLRLSRGHDEVHHEIPRTGSCPASWRSLFATKPHTPSPTVGPRLADFATVRRGVATGANHFFVLSEATRTEHALPDSVLRPLVRRLRDHRDDEVTAASLAALPERDRRWLLVVSAQDPSEGALQAYLTQGVHQGLKDRVLCGVRRDWFDLSDEATPPDVIVGPSTKSSFRFIVNSAQAQITNNLYGLIWQSWVPPQLRAEILSWLRSGPGQESLAAAARTQGGGLLKIEPRALKYLPLPQHFSPTEAMSFQAQP